MRRTATAASHRAARHRLLVMLVAGALVAAACGGDDDDGAADTAADTASADTASGDTDATDPTGDTDGGTGDEARELVIARDMDLSTLDPARAYCDTCQIYLSATYETLIGLDVDDPSIQLPRLATEWSANTENTEFTFALDPDATFADGSPVTAADVKWSWERLANVQGPASYLMGGLAGIETPDDHTVIVTFESPNSAFLPIVSAPYMVITNSAMATAEAQAMAEPGADADPAEPWFLEHSAGSGPYVLESFVEGDSLVLVRNESYWGTPATFPKVTIKQVQDSSAQLQQLQQGDVDIAMQLSIDALGQLGGDDSVVATPVDSYNFVYIALSPGAVGGEELQDADVRRAIKLAIDYEGMLDVTVAGEGNLQASPIPNGFPGSADLELPAQDLATAEQLLADAGLADGFELLAMYPKVNVYGVDFDVMMQKVQQDLKKVNIDVELQPVEFPQWSETIGAQGIPLTAVYFAPDHTDSSQYVQYFGMFEESPWAARAGGGESGSPIVNPDEPELLAQALAASGDEKDELYAQLGQEMIDDLVILPMVNPRLVLAHASDIANMHYSGCCNLELGVLGLSS